MLLALLLTKKKKQRSAASSSAPRTKRAKKNRPPRSAPQWHPSLGSPFLSLKSIYKAGDEAFLEELEEGRHVLYSQHNMSPADVKAFGEALNENAMWESEYVSRVSTGFSKTRCVKTYKSDFPPMNSLYEAASSGGGAVNTWVSRYHHDRKGNLQLHHDAFSYGQHARTIVTLGTNESSKSSESKLGGKYIRFKENGANGRWFECFLPHGCVLTLDEHGSGADVPRTEDGRSVVAGSVENAKGVRYVKHGIEEGHGTLACFVEWRAEDSSPNQVLRVARNIHGALPHSPIMKCFDLPPFPTALQIGQEECLKLSAQLKSALAALAQYGKLPLAAKDVHVEYGERGIYGKSHPKCPSNLPDGQVYCSYCDTTIKFESRGTVNQHLTYEVHKKCQELGSREEYDKEVFLTAKEQYVATFRHEGIEMGEALDTAYCKTCESTFSCTAKSKRGSVVAKKHSFVSHINTGRHKKCQEHGSRELLSSFGLDSNIQAPH